MNAACAGSMALRWLQGGMRGRAVLLSKCAYIFCGGQTLALYAEGPALPFGVRTLLRPRGEVVLGLTGLEDDDGFHPWRLAPERETPYRHFDLAAISSAVRAAQSRESIRLQAEVLRGLYAGPEELAASLIGRGPGLTPSGDDALVGVLYALHKTGSAYPLAQAVSALTDRTNVISAIFLSAAAQGEIFSALEEVFGPRAPAAAVALSRCGASSGQAVLAGLSAWLAFSENRKDQVPGVKAEIDPEEQKV